LRRIWLAGEIADVHKASGGTYGANRVQAELRYGRGIRAGHNAIELIMRELGIKGTPTRRLPKGARVARVTSLDLVRRVFARDRPNALWVTDITEHPTNEGKVYCCVVLDTFSRLVAGWAIDSTQTTVLVLNALGMATQRRSDRDGLIVHSDRGVQFTSWAFSNRLRDSGIAPSMGAVGAAGDNAMMESFWARLQVEVLNRRRWKTRIELATAIHDHIQFHNTRRRHSSLQMRTPSEIELAWTIANVAVVQQDLARAASTVAVAQAGSVGLAGTSDADISNRPSTSTSQQRPSRLTSTTRLHRNRGTSEPPSNPGRFKEQLDDLCGELFDVSELAEGHPDLGGGRQPAQPPTDLHVRGWLIQCSGRQLGFELGMKNYQVEAQTVLHPGALGDQLLAMIVKQPDLYRVWVKERDREAFDTFANDGASDCARIMGSDFPCSRHARSASRAASALCAAAATATATATATVANRPDWLERRGPGRCRPIA
jgi:putative transposase